VHEVKACAGFISVLFYGMSEITEHIKYDVGLNIPDCFCEFNFCRISPIISLFYVKHDLSLSIVYKKDLSHLKFLGNKIKPV
jgi:hypothetical protein